MKRFTFILLLTLSSPSWAATPQTPVQVEANQMLANQKDNSVFFSGRVEAKQDDLTIHADEMTVYYTGKPGVKAAKSAEGASPVQASAKGDNGKSPLDGGVERLLAKGHVELTKQGWVATGNQAEYFSEERKVVLTGDTKVWQNNNLVTGDTFVMYLDEGKSMVERGRNKGDRVKAFFYPNAEKP